MENSVTQSVIPTSEQQANLKMTEPSQAHGPSGSMKKPSIKLPSMSTVDTVMTKLVKEKIKESIEEPEIDAGLPHTVKQMSMYTICLPKIWQHFAEDLRKKIEDILIDSDMRDDLEGSQIINWCDSMKSLKPMKIAGDGNCLLHAVSKAMWGIHDNTLLRRLVYIALVEDDKQFIRKRWQCERKKLDAKIPDGGLELTEKEWDDEWTMVVKAAEDVKRKGNVGDELPFECLEEVHIFVLANVLMRPILVLAETVIRNLEGSALGINNFPGIYLPLLWDSSDCIRTPLILGYSMNHFTPLIGTEDDGNDSAAAAQENHAVPLVNHRLESLHVHFLLEDEEGQAHELLQKYMDITETAFVKSDSTNVILTAKLNYVKMDDSMDIVNKFFRMCEQLYTEYKEKCSKQEPVKVKCQTPGCKRYGKAELDFSCPRCYLRNTSESESDHSNGTNDVGEPTTESRNNVNVNTTFPPSSQSEPIANNLHLTVSSMASGILYDNQGERAEAAALPVAGAASNLQSPILSMLEEHCSYPGCDNHCAVTTKPYCHEHVFLAALPARNPHACHYPGCHEKISVSCKPYCQIHKLPTNEDEDSNGTNASSSETQCAQEGCKNFTTRFTHPYCYEHKQPSTSMIGEFCTRIGCANFQSESTKPFCHDHKNSASRRDSTHSSPDRETRSSRFDDMLPVFMAFICAIPSCDKKVSIDTDMYCREHYIEKYGELPRHASPSSTSTDDLPLPSRRVYRSSSSSESISPPRDMAEISQSHSEDQPRSLDTSIGLSGRSIRCQEPGCMLTGIASWNYCCSQHRVMQDNNSRHRSSGQDETSTTERASTPEENTTNRDYSSRLSRHEAATESRAQRTSRNESNSPTSLRVPPSSRPDRSPSSRSDDSTSPPSRRFSSGHRYDSSLHSRNEYSFPELSTSTRESRVPLYSSRYSSSQREYGSSRYETSLSRYGRSSYSTRVSSPSPTRSISPRLPAPPPHDNATETSAKEDVPKAPQQLIKSDKPMSKLDKTRELLRIGLCHKSGCKNSAENRYSGFCKSCAAHSQFLQIDAKAEEHILIPEPCKTNGCKLVGSPDFDGYCYQCQAAREKKQAKKETPQVNGHGSVASIEIIAQLPVPQAKAKAKTDTSKGKYKPILQCKTNGCLKIADEETEGYCPKCYPKLFKAVGPPTTNTVTNQANLAEMIGAYGGARPKESGRTKSGSLDRNEANLIPCPNLTPDVEKLANGRQVKISTEHSMAIPNLSDMEDTTKSIKRCTGHGCTRVAYDAFNGRCQLCYNNSAPNATRNGPRAPPSREEGPVENSNSAAQECKSDGCDMFGTDSQMGYCSTCYRKIKAKQEQGLPKSRRKPKLVAIPVQHEKSSSHFKSVAKPCKNLECDRFGDLNLQGYCYPCFESVQPVPVQKNSLRTNRNNKTIQPKHLPVEQTTVPERSGNTNGMDEQPPERAQLSYEEVLKKIEASSRTSYACCKNTGCSNMGNSRCRGFCNICFPHTS